ncbi:cell surface protein [Vibrio metschnikovii]|nr:cell surface protein [Vibrio metschnikovii]
MLKKTLLAAAVASVVSVPAFAKVEIHGVDNNIADWTITRLASVTKQPVLSFSTAQQNIDATFTRTGDIKQNGFITLEIRGEGTFNEAEIRQWLTLGAAGASENIDLHLTRVAHLGGTSFTAPGAATAETDLRTFFKTNTFGGEDIIEHAIDMEGKRLRLAIVETPNTPENLVKYGTIAGATAGEVDADVLAKVTAGTFTLPADSAALTTAGVTGGIDGTPGDGTPGTGTVGYLFADQDGTATTNAQKIAYIRGLADGPAYLNSVSDLSTDAQDSYVGANSRIDFKLDTANQAFNLKSESLGGVSLAVGALRNASYTADPRVTSPVFVLGDLFALKENTNGAVAYEAKVKEGYTKATLGKSGTSYVEAFATGNLALQNLTTNQNIQLDKVFLTLQGESLAMFANKDGKLVDASGADTGWALAQDGKSATKVVSTTSAVFEGKPYGGAVEPAAHTLNFNFALAKDNAFAIPAQTMTLQAKVFGQGVNMQDTYNDFASNLANVFVVTRDGLKFDTITTGSTSANTIHIRDISNILPEEGGKIYVTIVEYDAHGQDQNAAGNVLVERKELSLKLPSGGAVTLSPAGVAADVGAAINPARQARFVFEVETNIGEVAVKKQTSEGIDIQNGSQAPAAGVVDFTL